MRDRLLLALAIFALTFAPVAAQEPDPEPEVVEAEQAEPVSEEPAQEPAEEAPVEDVAEPAEEPAVEEPAPEPDPPSLADVYAALNAAITAGGSQAVTVAAANDALDAARAALDMAEMQHAAAMDGQAGAEADVQAAAQAMVDWLRATYGVN